MPARLPFHRARRLVPLAALVVVLGACLPLPTESATSSPSPTATPRPTPTPTPEPSATPEPTPDPYALGEPLATDGRRIQLTVTPQLTTDTNGQIVVTVTNLDSTRIQELVLRWASAVDRHLILAPFAPSSTRTCDGCPPLVQPWTKWVIGPGARGEPAGTTSLGWGPLDPDATLTIPVVVTRRSVGPISFDLQVLSGENLLTLEDGTPAWVRVDVP
jgi:hypothetical protein